MGNRAQEIKKRLKEELKYNTRQVSVRENPGGLSWSFDFTIRNPEVIYQKVKDFVASVESIDRCEKSGEILSGGNIYTHIVIAEPVKDEWSKEYLPLLEEKQDQFNDKNGIEVGQFSIHKRDNRLAVWYSNSWLNKHYSNLKELAVDLFIHLQTIKYNETNPKPEEPKIKQETPMSSETLLLKFDEVEVDNNSRISEADLGYCTRIQKEYDELTELLKKQLNWFEKKYNEAPANGAFSIHQDNDGTWSVRKSYDRDLRWDQQLKYTPLFSIAAIRNNLIEARKTLITNIKSYFESTYHISLDLSDLKMSDTQCDYETIIQLIFEETEGTDLFETGSNKIKEDFLSSIWKGRAKRKGEKIIIDEYASYDHWSFDNSYKMHYNEQGMTRILMALSHFEFSTNSISSAISNSIPHKSWHNRKIEFQLYECEGTTKFKGIRFFKNRRIDVVFHKAEYAEEFWNQFELHQRAESANYSG